MHQCLVGMGSNVGARRDTLDAAMMALVSSDVEVVAQSKWYEYPPVGGPPGQGEYLNGALLLRTTLEPAGLVGRLRNVELGAGRVRVTRWAARTLDCDLLLYGSEQIQTSSLTVPHPRLIARRFVLEPAAEIAGDLVHPELGWTLRQLRDHLDTSEPWFAFVGSNQAQVEEIVREVARQTKGRVVGPAPATTSHGLDWSRQLKFCIQFAASIDSEGVHADYDPLLSSFWFWQPLLTSRSEVFDQHQAELARHAPRLEPRLVVMCEPRTSILGQGMRLLPANLRRPTLWLSDAPQDALQDAVGAIMSMR